MMNISQRRRRPEVFSFLHSLVSCTAHFDFCHSHDSYGRMISALSRQQSAYRLLVASLDMHSHCIASALLNMQMLIAVLQGCTNAWGQKQGNNPGEVDVVTQGFSMQNQGKSPLLCCNQSSCPAARSASISTGLVIMGFCQMM